MPKLFFRKILPSPEKLLTSRTFRWFSPLLGDPRLWHLNRRSVTKAVYLGVLCAFIPLPIQGISAIICALLFRANLPLCILLTWLTNPLTFAPILYLAYMIGANILDVPMVSLNQLGLLLNAITQWVFSGGANPFTVFNASFSWSALALGLVIEAVIASLVCGTLIQYFWKWNVTRHWRNRHKTG